MIYYESEITGSNLYTTGTHFLIYFKFKKNK